MFGICIILLVTVVAAYELTTTYNPFTGKLDYHITGNLTGNNVTADWFFGNFVGETWGNITNIVTTGNYIYNGTGGPTVTLLFNESFLNRTINLIVTGTAGDNASWNQSFSDTLYAGIEWDYNQTLGTFNQYGKWWYNQTIPAQTYADANMTISVLQAILNSTGIYSTYNSTYGTWAYNQTIATFTLYNSTWDESGWVTANFIANSDLPLANRTSPYCGNITGAASDLCTITAGTGNASWNESHADTLYSAIEWGYNMTTATYNLYNAVWLSTYNATYDAFATNVSINYTLDTYNNWNTLWSAQTTIWDAVFNTTGDDRWSGGGLDGNASSICADDEVLLGNGTCQSSAVYFDDTNTQKGTTGPYLYNDSTNIIFNETILNETIDMRDNDTIIGNCSVDLSCTDVAYDSELDYTIIWDTDFNTSFADLDQVGTGNASWNESLANTLYSDIQWNYNQTIDTFNLWNTTWDNRGFVNLINESLSTRIDSSSGDNSSWNESHANTLYAPNTTAGIQYLINNTGVYSTYNATYDSYATNVSINYTKVTYDNWNTEWISTYNSTYVLYNDTDLVLSINTSNNIDNLGFLNKSGTNANQDINISPYNFQAGNLTLTQKITFSLGEILDNIVDGWIRITGGLNVTGSLEVGENITAIYHCDIGGCYNLTDSNTIWSSTYNSTYDSYKTNVSYGDIFINTTGDTMTGYLNMTGGQNMTLPDNSYACFGDAGCSDSYIHFNGSSLILAVN